RDDQARRVYDVDGARRHLHRRPPHAVPGLVHRRARHWERRDRNRRRPRGGRGGAMTGRDADHLDLGERVEAARQAECGDRSASWHPVPALLEGEGYPQAASAGGVTPTTVAVGVVVFVTEPAEAGAEVEG